MRTLSLILTVLLPTGVIAQAKLKDREEDFAKSKPLVGDALPLLTVYASDGKDVKTADLRGHYTVLTFGCLT